LIRLWGELGQGERNPRPGLRSVLGCLLRIFKWPAFTGALVGLGFARLLYLLIAPDACLALAAVIGVGLGLTGLCALLALLAALACDVRYGVIQNGYGLCKGGSTGFPVSGAKGIVDWLHEGIQRSAGLDINDDPPLTFRDLWCAPAYPGAERRDCASDEPQERRSINLQMITSNLTHGRPYRLPLDDRSSRLFYCRKELEGYFPAKVLDALYARSRPYSPQGNPGAEPAADHPSAHGLRELPRGDLPIVVAARLSLSFPLLFSAVPLWAIDYEVPRPDRERGWDVPHDKQRVLRRSRFSDGGVSSNFPVHLFDAAVPRWPTFGLWLDRRSPYYFPEEEPPGGEEEVWLPDRPGQGRGDSWSRFDPLSKVPRDDPRLRFEERDRPTPCGWRDDAGQMWGFLRALATSAADWRDRTNFRLPHVRNRVARLMLKPGEGGLHIGMGREQILRMAHRYGTAAGRKFVARYASADGRPTQAWNEQRWTRFRLLVNGLRERLEGLGRNAAWPVYSQPLKQAIDDATNGDGPIRDDAPITGEVAEALKKALAELEHLDDVLRQTPVANDKKEPVPELRLRPPL
jgi:Patatin-like phospholipase